MKQRYIAIFVATLLLLPMVVVAQQMYYWIDKDGVKRFSNQPPPPGVQIQGTADEHSTPVEAKPAPAPAESPATASASQPAASSAEMGPNQRALLDKRNGLAKTYNQLRSAALSITTDRKSVPSTPRHMFRKRQRVLNQKAVDLNKSITDLNSQITEFNNDPQRHKYRIPELGELPLLPVPKTDKKEAKTAKE